MTDGPANPTDSDSGGHGGRRSLEAEAMLRRISTRLFGADEKPVYLGRFRVLQTLGQGGMGAVYSAEDERLGRIVALKVIRPDATGSAQERLRLVREARALARLAHPNVVHIHEVGEHGDEVFIAMEYVPGKTLDRWLAASSPRLSTLLAVFIAIGRGLAAAHAAGIVHRDIKPTNVLVGDDGRPRIVDFGVSRGVHDGDTQPGHLPVGQPGASTDALAGTPAYMSPEHARGQVADARSDQFSFCATLYEALYGLLPYPVHAAVGPSDERPRLALGREAGDLQIPSWLRRILSRGLAIDPQRRFPAMGALIDALEAEPRRRERQLRFTGVTVVALATGLLAVPWADGRCDHVTDAFAETWGPSQRAAMMAGFAASRLPYAGRAASRVAGALDRYAEQWTAARQGACEASRMRGEVLEERADLSTQCLERQRRSVATLVELLVHPDVGVVTSADELVAALPRLDACRDPTPTRISLETPESASTEERLRGVNYLHIARRGVSALPVLAAVLAERGGGDQGLVAEALLLRGRIEATELREPLRAVDTFHRAALEAHAAGRDELTATAWNELARVNARELERAEEARVWLQYAQSAASRDTETTSVERAALLDTESYVALLEERYDAVEALRVEALRLRERALPAGDPELIWSRVAVANAMAERRGLVAALTDLSNLAEAVRAKLGADHPTTVLVEREIGLTLFELERFTEARTMLARVRAVLLDAFGPGNPHVASTDLMLAQIAAQQGDDDAVLSHGRAALAVFEAVFPPEYSERRAVLIELAELYRRTRQYGQSLSVHLALLDLHDRFGVDADVPGLLMNIGENLCQLGRCSESLTHFDRLRALLAREPPDDPGLLAYAARGAGLAHLADGQPSLALPFFEDAYRTLQANPNTSLHLTAETARSLAQCLRLLRVEPRRAARLERVAADIFRDIGEPFP